MTHATAACLGNQKTKDFLIHVWVTSLGNQSKGITTTHVNTQLESAIRDTRRKTDLVSFPEPLEVVRPIIADREWHKILRSVASNSAKLAS